MPSSSPTWRAHTACRSSISPIVYRGPDTDYRGREIRVGANETAVATVDVTDKGRPFTIAVATYPRVWYAHQGWMDEEHEFFYLNDEMDEAAGERNARTLVWDLRDLADPVLAGSIGGETRTTDHNLYIRGDLIYQSNYQSGLRIVDISNRERPQREVAPARSGGLARMV